LARVSCSIDSYLDNEEYDRICELEKIITLEEVALRIQAFYLTFLRKVNGSDQSGSDLSSRVAVFNTYTSAVEEQGHFIDLASEFLCDRSDVHNYNQLMKQVVTLKESDLAFGYSHSLTKGRRNRVAVKIIGAQNLMNADMWNGSYSDPYCTVEVIHQSDVDGASNGGTKLSTHVAKDNLNPVWNFSGILEGYNFGDSLLFQVFDKDMKLKDDDFLGSVELPSTEFESRTFSGDLMLTQPGTTKKRHSTGSHNEFGSIRVCVTAIRGEKNSSPRSGKVAVVPSSPRVDVVPSNGSSVRSLQSARVSDKAASSVEVEQFHSAASLVEEVSLSKILQRNNDSHQKFRRTVEHVVNYANREAEDKRIAGTAEICHSSRTGLWALVQKNVRLNLRDKLKESMPEDMTPMQRRDLDAEVDDILQGVSEETSFDLSNFQSGTQLTRASAYVACDSFVIMKLILQKIMEMDQLSIHSVSSTWKMLREIPLVTVKVSLTAEGELSKGLMKITLAHSKIVAIIQSAPGGNRAAQLLHEVPAICRTLNIEDPDVHPSMWCLSLGQLRELARLAEKQLGTDAYRQAHMYDIVQKCIMSWTAEARMSYSRMLNWQSLRHVDVFVSHAWKENFETFVNSVESALAQRLRADETSLWICSFALFQTKDKTLVTEQIGDELLDAPFDKALRRAKEVLVVRNAECDNFQRAWCVYEIFRARQLNLKTTITGPNCYGDGSVDILTCRASRADDEARIKHTIEDAYLVDELNLVVSEIKKKGFRQVEDQTSRRRPSEGSPDRSSVWV
jgi:hypothetical protein